MINFPYNIQLMKKTDNLEDYSVDLFGERIGELQLTINDDFIFIRQISIQPEVRRCGHATKIIDYLCEHCPRPIRLCISVHSNSAIMFWSHYFKTRNASLIRGSIYSLA